MASSAARRALFVDCTGIIKRYQYFYTPDKSRYYSFDRFCQVLIESIIHTQPSIIYTTASPDVNHSRRRELYPYYQTRFSSSTEYPTYLLNTKLLNELQPLLPINHIECPSRKHESGDIIRSIIHQYTTSNDEIFVLAQNKRFEQLLALNEASEPQKKRNIQCMKAVKKPLECLDIDDELNFMFQTTKHNRLQLSDNKQIIDYLSLIEVPGIGPVRAKQLLQFGNIPFLLENVEWNSEEDRIPSATQQNWILKLREDPTLLKLLYEKVIPFESDMELDENAMRNVKTVDKHNDSISLLRLMQPLAQKYQLKSVLWRLRHEYKFDDPSQSERNAAVAS